MLKSIRKRPRPDVLKTEQRRVTNRSGRMLYLGLLIAMLIAGINFLFGDLIFLHAEGLVLRDKSTLSASYLARVEVVNAKPGAKVVKGAIVLRLRSMEVLERLADLSSRNAGLAAKAAEFHVRSETVAKLLPLAERREQETAIVLEQFDQLSNVRLVTSARHDDALRARFEAQQSLVRFKAETDAFKGELAALNAARADAEAALADLRAHYADGVVHAPVSGAVGAAVPSVGNVVKPGEVILSIYSGEPYILANLPRRYLFRIPSGTRVKVSSGRLSAMGTITEILPVTGELPQEFQNTFKPRDRSQLARIQFDEPPPFPLHEKVEITSASYFF
jgi:multidrug resistance efflux pump